MRLELRQRYWCWRTERKRAKMNDDQTATFNRIAHDMHRVCEIVPWAHESWPHACHSAACAILDGTFDEKTMEQMEEYFQIGPYDDFMVCMPDGLEMTDEISRLFPGVAIDRVTSY